LVVEDELYMAEAIRDGLRLDAIAADIAGDGDIALELLGVYSYDIAVLDRDIPGPSGDEIAERIVSSGSGMPILMLTAADRIDDKAGSFELGADDYLTKPFELRELVLRSRALDRRRAYNKPPVRETCRRSLRLSSLQRNSASRTHCSRYRRSQTTPRATVQGLVLRRGSPVTNLSDRCRVRASVAGSAVALITRRAR
jgi:two-component system, OmpR family, response regulator VanR